MNKKKKFYGALHIHRCRRINDILAMDFSQLYKEYRRLKYNFILFYLAFTSRFEKKKFEIKKV